MKIISIAAGITGAMVTTIFGGWTSGVITLMIFMLLDYITGILVAAVFGKSQKTEGGGLSSAVGLKGICKKIVILILVAAAYRIDMLLSTSYVRDTVVIAFCVNELISIIENAGLMGLPIPSVIQRAISALESKADEE